MGKGNNGYMAIGGYWVVSDGSDPVNESKILINTAIRKAKELISIDLSVAKKLVNCYFNQHY